MCLKDKGKKDRGRRAKFCLPQYKVERIPKTGNSEVDV